MEKKNAWEKYPEGTKRQDVFTFAEEYRKFISSCKTEQETALLPIIWEKVSLCL